MENRESAPIKLVQSTQSSHQDISAPTCVHERFELQTELTPNAPALIFNNESFTYLELNQKANQLAHYLRTFEINPDTLVGICVERSPQMIISMLAVLKAGGAYVPIDPVYPKGRIDYMLRDSGVNILLTQESLLSSLPTDNQHVICLDIDAKCNWQLHLINQHLKSNLIYSQNKLKNKHLAYVIYTSGSTGLPKGVMIEHKSFFHFISSATTKLKENALKFPECWLAMTAQSFDISGMEIFLPLCNGGKIVLGSGNWLNEGSQLNKIIKQHKITTIQATPSAWKVIFDTGWTGYKGLQILIGGELVTEDIANKLLNTGAHVWNCYGPTEATIWTHIRYLNKTNEGELYSSIGGTLINTHHHVFTEKGQPAKIGEVGELYLGGEGLARGYLNKKDLTEEKFIHDCTNIQTQYRLYKTGDLVQRLSNGDLGFLGRIDDQVKIRGFRIELSEIEASLFSSGLVNNCVVLAQHNHSDNKYLTAYIVFKNSSDNHHSQNTQRLQIKQHLQEQLPEHMIPAAIIILAEIPLMPNGKIDRKALPLPDNDAFIRAPYVAPSTPIQETLCKIWQEVLHIDEIGIEDNFFNLGGDSVLAVQIVANITKTLSVSLPITEIFCHPNINELASIIFENQQGKSQMPSLKAVGDNTSVPISPIQSMYWDFIEDHEKSPHLHMPFALTLRGRVNIEAVRASLDFIVNRHDSFASRFRTKHTGKKTATVIEIEKNGRYDFHYSPLSSKSRNNKEVVNLLAKQLIKDFNLYMDPLLRVSLVEVKEHESVLLVNMNHLISDGWSMAIFQNEFFKLYDAYCESRTVEFPPLKYRHIDYINWLHQCHDTEKYQKQLSYWRKELSGFPFDKNFPQDSISQPPKILGLTTLEMSFSESQLSQLQQYCSEENTTLFMLFMSVFHLCLYRYSSFTDNIVNTPIAKRNIPELEQSIGFYVNILSSRAKIDTDISMTEFIKKIRCSMLEAQSNMDVHVNQLKQEKIIDYDLIGRMTGNILAFENFPDSDITSQHLKINNYSLKEVNDIIYHHMLTHIQSKLAFILIFVKKGSHLVGTLMARNDRYYLETLQKVKNDFYTLLKTSISDQEISIKDACQQCDQKNQNNSNYY